MSFLNPLSSDLILSGEHVELRPLQREHEQALVDAASDGELWKLEVTSVPDAQKAKGYIETAIAAREEGSQFPFVVYHRDLDKIVGSTRFYDIMPEHRNLAIGYTWYSKSVQRTAVNTECKLLLLEHAFNHLGCIAIYWHTDALNYRSQTAIERLGAKKDGVIRNHKIMPDGRVRDTVCYSILQREWGVRRATFLGQYQSKG